MGYKYFYIDLKIGCYEVCYFFKGDLIWTSADQGMLFAAMYWGGIVATLPSGWFINRYGSKRTITFSLIITLICTVTTPVAALYGGVWATFFARFFMGFGGLVCTFYSVAYLIVQIFLLLLN